MLEGYWTEDHPTEEDVAASHCGKQERNLSVLQERLSKFSTSKVLGDHTTLEVGCPPLSPSQVHSSDSFPHPFLHLAHPKRPASSQKCKCDENKDLFVFPFHLLQKPTSLFPEFTRSELPGTLTHAGFFFCFCFSYRRVFLGSRLKPTVLL